MFKYVQFDFFNRPNIIFISVLTSENVANLCWNSVHTNENVASLIVGTLFLPILGLFKNRMEPI